MYMSDVTLGTLMAAESAQAAAITAARLRTLPLSDPALKRLAGATAIYTIARGSSDAVAAVLAYEYMRELRVPVTSLPPSVFSLHEGVSMTGAGALVVSQSGASADLVASAKTARAQGGTVVAITNVQGSAVEAVSELTLGINAGPEKAVPATKTVIGGIAAGLALLAAIKPSYAETCDAGAKAFDQIDGVAHPQERALIAGLLRSSNTYVIGRGAGLGAAQEIALKLKECCALHAEAYSASEVLHGPLQLVTNPLSVIIIDTGEAVTQESLDIAQDRFEKAGSTVFRIRPSDLGLGELSPAIGAAIAINVLYPVIRKVAVAFGYNPDTPAALSKVTVTR